MIKSENLTLNRSSKNIVNNINYILNPGITSIIGPNGAGKTTLIKCLSGLIKDFEGSIEFKNKNLLSYKSKEIARLRAFASQSNEVSFPFSVKEIVSMGRYSFTDIMSKHENEKIVKDVIDHFSISHLSKQNFNTLSGGEKQRVQLARIFSQIWEIKEGLLFLDEPISALDFNYQVKLFKLIKNKISTHNWSVVIVLHDLQVASKFSNNIILMKDGIIFDHGYPENVLSERNLLNVYETPIKIIKTDDLNIYSIF